MRGFTFVLLDPSVATSGAESDARDCSDGLVRYPGHCCQAAEEPPLCASARIAGRFSAVNLRLEHDCS